MTTRFLEQVIGFLEKSADIRKAQYESESCVPKDEIPQKLAQALDVSPQAIAVPNIDSYTGPDAHILCIIGPLWLEEQSD